MMDERTGKKFYQRWWFWLIVALLLIIYFSGGDDEEPATTDDNLAETAEDATDETPVDEASDPEFDDQSGDEADAQQEMDRVIRSGTYKVGDDIPVGEYLVFADGSSYIESATDSTGEIDSIIFNENLMNGAHTYVTLNAGEYFKLQNGEMYPVEEAQSVRPDDGIYRDGTYKVGTDIEPGEYRVVLNDDAPMGMGYLEVSSDSSHRLESIVTNENVESDTYITVTEGQYLTISNVTIED